MEKSKRQGTIAVDDGPEAVKDPSARQCSYQEDNVITDVITQLLQIYRPEDDIDAYERALKKAQGLLGSCDSPRKRWLLSTIPVPKNVSDSRIAEVFGAATGFVKLDPRADDAMQDTLDAETSLEPVDVSTLEQELPHQDASKSSFSEGFPFRGFAENEISTTIRDHVKNVKHMCGVVEYDSPRSEETQLDVSSNPSSRADRQADSSSRRLNDNSQNRSDENKYQASICRQYLLNKSHHVPVECCLPRTEYQATETSPAKKTCDNTEMISDTSQDKPPLLNDLKYSNKKHDDPDVLNKEPEAGASKVAVDVELKSTRAIEQEVLKDNIRKMDDVCWQDEDRNFFLDADDLLATVSVGLKTSLSNFLKRVREGTSVETPAFPCTRSFPRPYSPVRSTSVDRKSATARGVSENDLGLATVDSDLSLKRQKTNGGSTKSRRNEKAEQELAIGPRTKMNSCELGKVDQLPPFRNDPADRVAGKKIVGTQCRGSDAKETFYGRKIRPRSSEMSAEKSFNRIHSMSELAAYKKQYYDTLLSVQRAKVAVSNSLASSSAVSSSCSSSSLTMDRLTAYDEPYYSNYTCQQQHLFQQQRQFAAMRPQFPPACSATPLSGLMSVQQQQHGWARSDCKYLLLKQLRLRRQTSSPAMYATRDQGSWIHHYVGPIYPYRPFVPDESDRTGQCVRRKSLEDIVGKLKGAEHGSVNN